MPSKGKKVAARQNNLRRRRSGANRAAPARNPVAAAPVATAVAEPVASVSAPAAATAETEARPQAQAAAVGRPATARRGRRFDRPAAYNHVGAELRRIGIFSGVLVVVLVAVSFVL